MSQSQRGSFRQTTPNVGGQSFMQPTQSSMARSNIHNPPPPASGGGDDMEVHSVIDTASKTPTIQSQVTVPKTLDRSGTLITDVVDALGTVSRMNDQSISSEAGLIGVQTAQKIRDKGFKGRFTDMELTSLSKLMTPYHYLEFLVSYGTMENHAGRIRDFKHAMAWGEDIVPEDIVTKKVDNSNKVIQVASKNFVDEIQALARSVGTSKTVDIAQEDREILFFAMNAKNDQLPELFHNSGKVLDTIAKYVSATNAHKFRDKVNDMLLDFAEGVGVANSVFERTLNPTSSAVDSFLNNTFINPTEEQKKNMMTESMKLTRDRTLIPTDIEWHNAKGEPEGVRLLHTRSGQLIRKESVPFDEKLTQILRPEDLKKPQPQGDDMDVMDDDNDNKQGSVDTQADTEPFDWDEYEKEQMEKALVDPNKNTTLEEDKQKAYGILKSYYDKLLEAVNNNQNNTAFLNAANDVYNQLVGLSNRIDNVISKDQFQQVANSMMQQLDTYFPAMIENQTLLKKGVQNLWDAAKINFQGLGEVWEQGNSIFKGLGQVFTGLEQTYNKTLELNQNIGGLAELNVQGVNYVKNLLGGISATITSMLGQMRDEAEEVNKKTLEGAANTKAIKDKLEEYLQKIFNEIKNKKSSGETKKEVKSLSNKIVEIKRSLKELDGATKEILKIGKQKKLEIPEPDPKLKQQLDAGQKITGAGGIPAPRPIGGGDRFKKDSGGIDGNCTQEALRVAEVLAQIVKIASNGSIPRKNVMDTLFNNLKALGQKTTKAYVKASCRQIPGSISVALSSMGSKKEPPSQKESSDSKLSQVLAKICSEAGRYDDMTKSDAMKIAKLVSYCKSSTGRLFIYVECKTPMPRGAVPIRSLKTISTK